MDVNAPQPPPVANIHEPSWPAVIETIGTGMGGLVHRTDGVGALVVADMHARDAEGRRKYGVPLQPHNGRDSLVDAYQEALDLVVYLWTSRVEAGRDGIGPSWSMLDRAVELAGDIRALIAKRGWP